MVNNSIDYRETTAEILRTTSSYFPSVQQVPCCSNQFRLGLRYNCVLPWITSLMRINSSYSCGSKFYVGNSLLANKCCSFIHGYTHSRDLPLNLWNCTNIGYVLGDVFKVYLESQLKLSCS